LLACRNESAQAIFSRSEDVSIDMDSIFKAAIHIIDGKGGGNSRAAQGGGRTEGLDDFIKAAEEMLMK